MKVISTKICCSIYSTPTTSPSFFRVFGLPDVSPVSPENLQSKNLKTSKNQKPQNLKIFHFSTVGNISFFEFFHFFSFFSSHFAPLAKLIFKNLKNGILTHATTFLLKKSSSFFLWIVLQLPPTVLSFALLSCQRRPHTTYCPTLKREVLGGTQRNQRSAVPTQSIAE